MAVNPTIEELFTKVNELEEKIARGKAVEKALKESEKFSSSLLENSPDAIIVYNPGSSVKYVNPAFEKITGYTSQEVLGKTIPYPWWIEDPEYGTIEERSNLGLKGFYRTERRYRKKNGDQFYVDLYVTPIYDDGKLSYSFSTWTDISERKKAEQELRKSSLIIDSTSDAVITSDVNGNINLWNNGAEKILGYKKEEITGKPASLLFKEENLHILENIISKLNSGNDISGMEIQVIDKNGEDQNVLASMTTIKDEHGDIVELVGLVKDIAELKKTQNDLLETNRILNDIQRNAKIGNWWTHRIWDIVYWSEEMYHIFGLDPNSEPPDYEENRKIIHPDDWEIFDTAIMEAVSNGTGYDIEFRILRPSGEIRYVNSKGYPEKDNDGNVRRLVGLTRDITERKEMEESLKKAHDDLEERVKKRTKDLNEANKALEAQSKNLQDLNTALKVLLEKRDKDKEEEGEKVLLNVKEFLIPYVEKLKKGPLTESQGNYIELLESGLNEIISPFAQKLSSRYMHVTPRELQVANLVKEGKTSKEIAEILNCTERTIVAHRANLRKKFGLDKKSNLRTYLLTLK